MVGGWRLGSDEVTGSYGKRVVLRTAAEGSILSTIEAM